MSKSKQTTGRARKFQYVCAICNFPVSQNVSESVNEDTKKKTRGLGTMACPKHPKRAVTVLRDTSGGQEQGKQARQTPTTVIRPTLVKRIPVGDKQEISLPPTLSS